jgi:hypothetical protein
MKITFYILTMLPLIAFYTLALASEPNTDAAHQLTYLSIIAKGAKVACANDKYGNPACMADGYRIDFGECSDDSFYGGITAKAGVTLEDQVSTDRAQPVARLQDKQFVCIEATARKGEQERYFVRAVPVTSVPGCKGNDLCKSYGDHFIQWIAKRSGKPCQRKDRKSYKGDCAAGWIDNDALEEFSMGL